MFRAERKCAKLFDFVLVFVRKICEGIFAKNNSDTVKINFDVLEEAGYNIDAYKSEIANHSAAHNARASRARSGNCV